VSAIGPTGDQVLILVRLTHEQLFLGLARLRPFQGLDDTGWNGNRASCLLSLGRLEYEPRLFGVLAGPMDPDPYQLLVNMHTPPFKVEVLPLQSQEFPAPQPCAKR
jgi:hypothetical protein